MCIEPTESASIEKSFVVYKLQLTVVSKLLFLARKIRYFTEGLHFN